MFLRKNLGSPGPKIAFAIGSRDAKLLWINCGVSMNNVFDLQEAAMIAFPLAGRPSLAMMLGKAGIVDVEEVIAAKKIHQARKWRKVNPHGEWEAVNYMAGDVKYLHDLKHYLVKKFKENRTVDQAIKRSVGVMNINFISTHGDREAVSTVEVTRADKWISIAYGKNCSASDQFVRKALMKARTSLTEHDEDGDNFVARVHILCIIDHVRPDTIEWMPQVVHVSANAVHLQKFLTVIWECQDDEM